MRISHAVVGWLIFLAASVTFACGLALRSFIGRKRDAKMVRRVVSSFRSSALACMLFGPIQTDALDDEELDQMILMPTIVVACGLCLTALFMLGYESLG